MPQPLGFGPHTIPRKRFGFGATQAHPHYDFDATQTNPIGSVPHISSQRHYGFGANQAKLQYGFGSSYSNVYCHLPPVDFNAEILATLKEAGEIIPFKPSSSVLRKTLLQFKQDFQLAVQNSQVNMHNPNRHFLRISDINITYLTGILHKHQQRLRKEALAPAAATATANTPNTSSLATMSTLAPETPLSEPPEET